MITAGAIQSAYAKAALLTAVGLTVFVCLALFARWRWPTLAVRVATSLAILLVLVGSPAIVSMLAGPQARLGWFVGVYVHPGWAVQFGPAIIAAVVGLGFALVVLRRGRRRESAA